MILRVDGRIAVGCHSKGLDGNTKWHGRTREHGATRPLHAGLLSVPRIVSTVEEPRRTCHCVCRVCVVPVAALSVCTEGGV